MIFSSGTNCDEETEYAFKKAGGEVFKLHINYLKRNKKILKEFHILSLPGGFTYGDYISAGKILANELRYYFQEEIKDFIKEGKLIIGICNGFQILCKAGLLPGFDDYFSFPQVTLTFNDSQKFECRWVSLKVNHNSPTPFIKDLDEIIELPIAHAEGKFFVDKEEVLKKLKENNQIVLKYINNPNGSIEDIAGICDATGRIFGLMPHPERFIFPLHHPLRKNKVDGLKFFINACEYAKREL
ncbi:MAG: phosphoribosylformylglycinamidine synthase I [candidate division WOR-3 bacterium]|nr:phosphoribosylformylglycinamidine synthase I [candidate division WOR-3 bacterium]